MIRLGLTAFCGALLLCSNANSAIVKVAYSGDPLVLAEGPAELGDTLPGYSGAVLFDTDALGGMPLAGGYMRFGVGLENGAATFMEAGLTAWDIGLPVAASGAGHVDLSFGMDGHLTYWDLGIVGDIAEHAITAGGDMLYLPLTGAVYKAGPGLWTVEPVPAPAEVVVSTPIPAGLPMLAAGLALIGLSPRWRRERRRCASQD